MNDNFLQIFNNLEGFKRVERMKRKEFCKD